MSQAPSELHSADPSDPKIWPRIPLAQQARGKYKPPPTRPKREGPFPLEKLERRFLEAVLRDEDRMVFDHIRSAMKSVDTNGAWRYAEHHQRTGHVILVQFKDTDAPLPRLTRYGYEYIQALRMKDRLRGRTEVEEELTAELHRTLATTLSRAESQ